jgi:hypothetical protein
MGGLAHIVTRVRFYFSVATAFFLPLLFSARLIDFGSPGSPSLKSSPSYRILKTSTGRGWRPGAPRLAFGTLPR